MSGIFYEAPMGAESVESLFSELPDYYSTEFSKAFLSLIAAIFIDSDGNLETTYLYALRLMQSHHVKDFPLKAHNLSKVLNLWRTKPYSRELALKHIM